MTTRRNTAPGIEVNEIDNTRYNEKIDYSLKNAPVCFMCGFSDKGESYTTKWINTKATFINEYGNPKTEFEKYFYNGMCEVINRGGLLLTSKLPYDNESKDNYTYTTYQIENTLRYGKIQEIIEPQNFNRIYNNVKSIQDTCLSIITNRKLNVNDYILYNINGLVDTVDDFSSRFIVQGVVPPSDIVELSGNLIKVINEISGDSKFFDLTFNDSYIKKYINIIPESSGKMSIQKLDEYIVRDLTTTQDKITIVDISRGGYSRANETGNYIRMADDKLSTYTNDCLGIVPVIISPINALYFQGLLHNAESIKYYNAISSLNSVDNKKIVQNFSNLSSDLYIQLNSDNVNEITLSKIAANQFPIINYKSGNHFDPDLLKQIGVVVFKMYKDQSNNGVINFELVESFIGSLDKNAKDRITNSSIFIDTLINTKSNYINLFSNINHKLIEQCDTVGCFNQKVTSLGFYNYECVKNISYKNSIMDPLDTILENVKDSNSYIIDVIVDAGVSNIAQFQKTVNMNNDKDLGAWSLNMNLENETSIKEQFRYWNEILGKFDNFAKYTRKDCIFIADGIRPFCLEGNEKIIRKTKQSNTIEKNIIPKLKYMKTLNSSYSTGYCDWFKTYDEYSGDSFWIPPSIKASGIYCYVDTYFHKWDAPAGLIRGGVGNVFDLAFSPTPTEAGKIYSNQWNYAISYPLGGIVLEGQKTFQQNNTSLDRVNVRKLVNYLKKKIKEISNYFVYDKNNTFNRQRLVEDITVVLKDAVRGGGIKDFAIKCDDENNTTQVIDRNELRCSVAIIPVKSMEYIIINLVSTSQNGNVSEEVIKNM